MLTTGDIVRLNIHAESEEAASQVLRAVSTSEELRPQLTAIPNVMRQRDAEFGEITLAQEFIVVAAAHLSAEALFTALRGILAHLGERHTDSQHDSEEAHPEVTISVPSEGMCDVIIRVHPLK